MVMLNARNLPTDTDTTLSCHIYIILARFYWGLPIHSKGVIYKLILWWKKRPNEDFWTNWPWLVCKSNLLLLIAPDVFQLWVWTSASTHLLKQFMVCNFRLTSSLQPLSTPWWPTLPRHCQGLCCQSLQGSTKGGIYNNMINNIISISRIHISRCIGFRLIGYWW